MLRSGSLFQTWPNVKKKVNQSRKILLRPRIAWAPIVSFVVVFNDIFILLIQVSYQPDARRIGGGKLLSGRPHGLSDAGKLVQLRLVETGQLHPSKHASSSQISSPSLSASSPASPDTQQCSSTTHLLQVSYIT